MACDRLGRWLPTILRLTRPSMCISWTTRSVLSKSAIPSSCFFDFSRISNVLYEYEAELSCSDPVSLRYCRRIRGTHWGSDIEIQALCKVTGHSVQVYSAERIIWYDVVLRPPFWRFVFCHASSGSILISGHKLSTRHHPSFNMFL